MFRMFFFQDDRQLLVVSSLPGFVGIEERRPTAMGIGRKWISVAEMRLGEWLRSGKKGCWTSEIHNTCKNSCSKTMYHIGHQPVCCCPTSYCNLLVADLVKYRTPYLCFDMTCLADFSSMFLTFVWNRLCCEMQQQ